MISLRVAAVVSVVLLSTGCFSTLKDAYLGQVLVEISPQPTEALRTAFLRLGGFERRQVTSLNPTCTYYDKYLLPTGMIAYVDDCFGDDDRSKTRWAYIVSVHVYSNRGEVRRNVDELVEQIRQALQAALVSQGISGTIQIRHTACNSHCERY